MVIFNGLKCVAVVLRIETAGQDGVGRGSSGGG
jgi:hypothetical protein